MHYAAAMQTDVNGDNYDIFYRLPNLSKDASVFRL
jgi:hypothetical protein